MPDIKHVAEFADNELNRRHQSDDHFHATGNIKDVKLNGNVLGTAFIACFGSSFMFGYNLGVLNQPSELIKQFYNSTYTSRRGGDATGAEAVVNFLWPLTTALFIPGGIVGSLFSGALADKFGRTRAVILSETFAIVGSILAALCVTTNLPELLLVGRLLIGFTCGVGLCVSPMFLSEIAPLKYRGALSAMHQLAIAFGIFISSLLGIPQIFGTQSRWPFLLGVEVVPAVVAVTLWFLPDSPRYLLLIRRQREAARKALEFYMKTTDNELIELATEEIISETRRSDDVDNKPFTVRELFTAPHLRRPLMIALMLQLMLQFSGINAVFFYSLDIFIQAGIAEAHVPYAIVGTNAVNVVATFVSMLVVDRFGRRKMLLFSMLVMSIDLILLTISMNLQSTVPWMSILSIVFVFVYVIGFSLGLGTLAFVVSAELFMQRVRPLALSAAGVANWSGNFVIAMAFPPVQQLTGSYTFLIFAALLLFFALFTRVFIPETKNRTFEEIAAQFLTTKNDSNRLDVEDKRPINTND